MSYTEEERNSIFLLEQKYLREAEEMVQCETDSELISPVIFFDKLEVAKQSIIRKAAELRVEMLSELPLKETIPPPSSQENAIVIAKSSQNTLGGICLEVVPDPEAVLEIALPRQQQLPPKTFASVPPQPASGYTPMRNKEISCYELTQRLLQRVSLARWQGNIYRWDGIIYRPLSDDDLAATILSALEPEIRLSGSPSLLKGTAIFIKASERLNASPITDPTLICFSNGTLDLKTWSMTAHTTAEFFTSYVDVDFNPGAAGACPNFQRFLMEVTGGDPLLQQRIWEIIGYLLTADMSAKVFIVFQGVGDSGKSVLGNLISSLFNQESVCNLDIFRFRDRFSTSALVGKRLNISMDLPNSQLSQEAVGTIKMLTGQDAITVEPKFKDSFPYRPLCKLVFGTNHSIRLQAPDQAFENRLLLVPFRYMVPKERQDKGLVQRLELEKTAIVARALSAYIGLVKNGYCFAGGMMPAVETAKGLPVIDATKVISEFIENCCTFDANAFTPTEILHDAHQQYSAQMGFTTMDKDTNRKNGLLTTNSSMRPHKRVAYRCLYFCFSVRCPRPAFLVPVQNQHTGHAYRVTCVLVFPFRDHRAGNGGAGGTPATRPLGQRCSVLCLSVPLARERPHASAGAFSMPGN